MAQNVYANGSAAKEIFIKNGGSWQTVKGVWVKDGGVWRQCFPAASSTQSYTTAGTYSFTVPNGIYSLTTTVVGAGGGGGGFRGNGDNHAGGGGGSGGFYANQTLAVTPGETLTVVVGAGGGSASYNFNGGWQCIGTAYGQTGDYWNGTAGGTTTLSRGATVLYSATGGGPGLGAGPGDTMGTAAPGAGGSPNGVVGGTPNTNRNNYPAAPGGSNGTGYGTGGNGNGNQSGILTCPGVGGAGAVVFTW